MKRSELLRHLKAHGCRLFSEGARHSIFVNRAPGKATSVPRHREINDFLARRICRDLEIAEPWHRTAVTIPLDKAHATSH